MTSAAAKTIWCIFVVVVKFIGIFAYLIARRHGMTTRSIEQQQQISSSRAARWFVHCPPVAQVARGADRLGEEPFDDGTVTQAELTR